jgi:hypothetical protein
MATSAAVFEAQRPAARSADVRSASSFMNPYLAGIGLGLVLLAAFVFVGRGLGASGAMSTAVAVAVDRVAPEHAESNDFYLGYLEGGFGSPWKSFLVFEVIGVLTGGFLSGALAGRIRRTIERGPRMSAGGRMALATLGGALMGIGAKLARGCTSGQALSGGAVLGVGSWLFMIMVFVGGYAGAYFLRKEWI